MGLPLLAARSLTQQLGEDPTQRLVFAVTGWGFSLIESGEIQRSSTDGANRHDSILFEPTLHSAAQRGQLFDVETLHLDRAYDSKAVRALCEAAGITDVICARKRPRGQARHTKVRTPLGMRWTVERTNSWLSNYGQLRRNTDRCIQHRLAQICLAIVLIITVKLINWRNRWNPTN